MIVLGTTGASGGPLIAYNSPTDFFTNVAARLLKTELGALHLDLNNIQVYPTNQYTPAVHRLLQVTANLYDSTTNRILGITPEYPYCPTVFRPLFRRIGSGSNMVILIAGYQEVVNADLANPSTAPLMLDLSQPNPRNAVPYLGIAFSPIDKDEPLVSGIPLIIGARKGFPNFNELAMQTQIYVSRLLEFRRGPGNPQTSPVIQTNQMYVLGVSNCFGLEAWNAYLTNYPRDLQLIASATITAVMTNEVGGASNVLFTNIGFQAFNTNIASGSWPGWSSVASTPASMVLPFGTTTGFNFLPNSTVLDRFPWFEPQTHIFPTATQGAFYVPHWWFNLNTRLIFILLDTQANRIVDYVNLDHSEPTLDITAKLMGGNSATTNAFDYRNPANEWLTNRLGNSSSTDAVTYGIMNQIQVGLVGTFDWLSYVQDPASGLDAESAVDGFRYNLMGLAPIYPKDLGKTFYKSNVFYAPFDPYRPIYIHTSWQANDPLVHFLTSDLIDLGLAAVTNRVDFVSHNPPLDNLGRINNRFRPWGGNPMSVDPALDYQMAVKDPAIYRSDSWDFPTNQSLGIDWVGRVHRGTPWQTIFLKSTNILLQTGNPAGGLPIWALWTGNSALDVLPSNSSTPYGTPDAIFTAPSNDWHLVSTLNLLFNTNAPQQLTPVNQTSASSWEALLNGLTVLTNVSRIELDPVVMSGNSPQAVIIAQAILQNRSSQPGQFFRSIGDILSTPELSVASPWLDPTNLLTDEALEIIPSQLLPLLRADSFATVAAATGGLGIQFTGIDGNNYSVQVSSNLVGWTAIATNTPQNGLFNFIPPDASAAARFYRSRLLP